MLFDIDLLNERDPFEIDTQAAHLFKHAPLGVDDVFEVWHSDPIFYPAKPPAHWLMVSEIEGKVLMVALLRQIRTTQHGVGQSVATTPPNT